MPDIPIIMPQLGESISEATIIDFLVQEGDPVTIDQDIIEVETNKAAMNVTAPAAGTIKEFTSVIDESYLVGAVLGYIETNETAIQHNDNKSRSPDQSRTLEAKIKRSSTSSTPAVKPIVENLPIPADGLGVSYLSPRLKARMHELGLRSADLAGIAGSGAGGRITIQDFESFIAELNQTKLSQASSMRVTVADAMCRSWTRPLATAGLPVILDPLLRHRKTLELTPGPALYVIRALALALSEDSTPAGRLIGRNIAHPASIDVGFAVEAEDGVLVPVLREADKQSLAEMIPRYQEMVTQARERRLPADATGKSIATVTNYGTFGLTWATPIPLPEQTLVLGMGAGRKQPVWDEAAQTFVPQTEAFLTLSFDHRAIDGGPASRLLSRIGELMGQPERL
ncbi:MAG: Dihydrolipoyllysine-residue acetyltransferase component of pyruvate dehydrogenase complex [Verrucomicrobia subdivision 3 bacterium]|nr:Dihydrolipoyllysine-residue acetyltransferase component of pyruvate dehydrogenase complex [Limisphaerales bacterium]MCS1415142.1 Dihydrolipoyllysine-residue acetyltransferase component of pyruvate dehydrogenase complex [Limisphaerales bacterium]